MLPARMRTSAGWSDACILNVSSRGLLVHTRLATPDGATVELFHGEHVIIARVVWRQGPRVGLAAEDRVPIEQILTLGRSVPLQLPSQARRRRQRAHERSREHSRLIEFVGVAGIAITLSVAATIMVSDVLAAPMARVRVALDTPAPVDSRN